MSYGVMAYLIDTNEFLEMIDGRKTKKRNIFNIFGSKTNTKNLIEKEYKDDFDDLDESIHETMEYDTEFKNPSLSRVILEEFLNNNIKNSSYGYVYGYVFEKLCMYKGDFLDNSEWYPCSNENYYGIPFSTYELPVKFPYPDDFPAISYINYKNIKLDNANYEDLDDEQKNRLIDWFDQATASKKDIYLFYY